MRNTKLPFFFAFILTFSFAGSSFGQDRVLGWLPGSDESVRLDPGNYHVGITYRTFPNGGDIQVDIKSELPVTVFLTPADDWNAAMQHPEALHDLKQLCPREHVVEVRYACFVPPVLMNLIVRDDRNDPDKAVFAGLGVVLDPNNKAERAVGQGVAAIFTGQGSAGARRFKSPNDVHIQYFHWDCIENCIQPQFQWIEQVKEKYQLTSFLKVYGGYAPDHDAAQVSIKIKSPVPMVVAMVPSDIANQFHAKPETLESALEKNSCQQRGVQSLQFQCTFNQADGPQSLIVVPEDTSSIPHNKKAEIEMQFVKCIANCQMLETKR